MSLAAVALIIYVGVGTLMLGRQADSSAVYNAIAVFRPGIVGGGVLGVVRFQKGPNCTVAVKGNLSGLRPNDSYGLRVHEAGDLRGGCGNTGAPWNPRGGSNSTAAPAGDLGNMRSDASGNANIEASNPTISFVGLAELYGRSVVLYNLNNDTGRGSDGTNTSSGMAGTPVACAVIGTSGDAVVSDDCTTWLSGAGLATDNVGDVGVATFVGDVGGIGGSLQFKLLANCSIQVLGAVSGLRRSSLQASHVHMIGDLTGPCNYTGSHLNPTNASHGSGLTSSSHAGDLGNLLADGAGAASVDLVNPVMSQLSLRSLYGLSVVIHNLTDDLGVGNNSASLSNGNAGPRIACAVVGRGLRVTTATGPSDSAACRRSSATQSGETTPKPTSGGLRRGGSGRSGSYVTMAAVQAVLTLLLRG